MDHPNAPRTKARYAAALLPLVTNIVAAVHDEGPDALREALNAAYTLTHRPDDTDPALAIITILAAMVDPTASTEQTLGWVRELTPIHITPTPTDEPRTDTAAIDACIAGRLHANELTPTNRREVVRRLIPHMNVTEIAERTGMTPRTIERAKAKLRATKTNQTAA